MNAVVIEHVRGSIEEEEAADQQAQVPSSAITANPLFGMWRDREVQAVVAAYVHDLR